MIELRQACTRAGDFSMGPLDLHMERGSWTLLLGESGAGKSLVLDLIAGFREPTRGEVWLRGESAAGKSPDQRRIGWVPQSNTLFPHLDVLGNLEFGLRATGVSPPERAKRIEEISEHVDLKPLLHREGNTLSGGERQRVALARTLVLKPDVLLLDEPFSSVEPKGRLALWRLIASLHQTLDLTVVQITHDLNLAEQFAQDVAVIRDGRVTSAERVAKAWSPGSTQTLADALGL